MKHNLVAAVGILLVGLTLPLWAHHSTTMFVMDKQTTLEGTITEVAWGNPHSVLFIDAKPSDQPNGAVKNWSIEAPSPRRLLTLGWNKETVKAGDKVKITGFARKDGKTQILFIELTDEKGHRFGMNRADYQGE